jgi:ribokinase
MAKIVVVGSIGVDLVAYAPRLPVKGETILGDAFERFPGAKGANQAVAAALAGAPTAMVGAVGDDANGEFMRETLTRHGIDIAGIESVAEATQVALIMVGGGDNQIVVVPGANMYIDVARVASFPFGKGDVCVAQGETRIEVVEAAFTAARKQGALTLLNPAPAAAEARPLLALADIVVVNETECEFFAGVPFDLAKPEASLAVAERALGLRADQVLVATLGAAGVAAWHGAAAIRLPGHRVTAVDSTGAGDCFVGTFAAALVRGDPVDTALREANAAAALSVGGKGALASFPQRTRVLQLLRH